VFHHYETHEVQDDRRSQPRPDRSTRSGSCDPIGTAGASGTRLNSGCLHPR
jgi:hypothetical protein